MKVHLVCAARPNFVKVAPLYHALRKCSWAEPYLVHTGQHYDYSMSTAFFEDFQLPQPHFFLGAGSGSHAEQTAQVLVRYEALCIRESPDLVVVVGDVNSTLAAALAAKKLNLRVAHLEAGLRSHDRTMPEEINRLATDAISDLLWTPSEDADENLVREGHPRSQILCVGNIMIDALELLRPRIESHNQTELAGLRGREFGLVTLHRGSNVDNEQQLGRIVSVLGVLAARIPLVFPVHPRTRSRLMTFGLLDELIAKGNILIQEPLPYVPFMKLVFDARLVITDSGGVQEETTYLGIPCFTMRPNTERPITVTMGSNRLVSLDSVVDDVMNELRDPRKRRSPPALWDGQASARIVDRLRDMHSSGQTRGT